jgi:hypothetical protein
MLCRISFSDETVQLARQRATRRLDHLMARKKRKLPATPEICPACGEEVPCEAAACPECGADHKSGWRLDEEAGNGLDLPETDFDYDEFVREEFGRPLRPRGLAPIWWVTALLVIALLIAIWIHAGSR